MSELVWRDGDDMVGYGQLAEQGEFIYHVWHRQCDVRWPRPVNLHRIEHHHKHDIEVSKAIAQSHANAIQSAIEAARPSESRVLTCVYCGHEYPQGTPAAGSQVLTDHIKACTKHPMTKLRAALAALVGVDGKAELEEMEATIRLTPAPARDKAAIIDAINALQDSLPTPPKETK
jgi:hypothetical protein